MYERAVKNDMRPNEDYVSQSEHRFQENENNDVFHGAELYVKVEREGNVLNNQNKILETVAPNEQTNEYVKDDSEQFQLKHSHHDKDFRHKYEVNEKQDDAKHIESWRTKDCFEQKVQNRHEMNDKITTNKDTINSSSCLNYSAVIALDKNENINFQEIEVRVS